MLLADRAQLFGLHRLAVPLHGSEQLGDAAVVDTITSAEECRQRHARRADFFEDKFLFSGAGKPAELADELAHGARLAAAILIALDVGAHEPPQPSPVIPVWRGWIA